MREIPTLHGKLNTSQLVEEVFSEEPHRHRVPSAPNPLTNQPHQQLREVRDPLIVLQLSVNAGNVHSDKTILTNAGKQSTEDQGWKWVDVTFLPITSFRAGINSSESAGEAPAAEARAASSSSLDLRPPDLGALVICRSTPSSLCTTSSLQGVRAHCSP